MSTGGEVEAEAVSRYADLVAERDRAIIERDAALERLSLPEQERERVWEEQLSSARDAIRRLMRRVDELERGAEPDRVSCVACGRDARTGAP